MFYSYATLKKNLWNGNVQPFVINTYLDDFTTFTLKLIRKRVKKTIKKTIYPSAGGVYYLHCMHKNGVHRVQTWPKNASSFFRLQRLGNSSALSQAVPPPRVIVYDEEAAAFACCTSTSHQFKYYFVCNQSLMRLSF